MSLKKARVKKTFKNEKHRDPLNDKVREKYHTTLQQYKKLLNHKRSEYYNLIMKISELENITYNSRSDTKTFWNCVKSMDDSIKCAVTPPISKANWLNYFQNLHFNKPLTSDQQKVVSELRKREDTLKQSRPLNYPITEAEILSAAKKLKNNNKSAYSDKIRNEIIKASLPMLLPVYPDFLILFSA